jgi:hypothetical protein
MSKRKSKAARMRQGRDTRGPLQKIVDREANDNARVGPTDAHANRASFVRDKEAYRKVPVIETMHTRGQINDAEYRALAFYRDQAGLAERSPVKSCLDNSVGGSGDIPLSAAITSAVLTTARVERDLGQLAQLARAVAVDDRSLSQWCIDKHGGRERYDGAGKFIAIVPLREKQVMAMAAMELKMAAHRIVS